MDSVCEPGLDSQSPRITLALWMRRMSNYEIDKKNMEKGLKPVIHNREARKAIRSLAAHIALPASFPICHSEPRSGEESVVCWQRHRPYLLPAICSRNRLSRSFASGVR